MIQHQQTTTIAASIRRFLISLLAYVGFGLAYAAPPLEHVPEGLAPSDWQNIRAAYEAGRHSFQPVVGGWQARNPGQQWSMQFDHRGFIAQPKDKAWSWGLQLTSYGFGEAQTTVPATPSVKAADQHLSYQWDALVQEWFVNDQRGLEHGFTVAARPAQAGEAELSFLLSTRGDLKPRVDTQAVAFQDAAGATVLTYSGLKVWDADGKILPSRFEMVSAQSFRLLVDEHAARYPITIDPIAQQAYLKASYHRANDQFGYSVAVSGDTVVIGAPLEDSADPGDEQNEDGIDNGAAYVFVRTGSTWSQQAYLKASNTGGRDRFGQSVAISGDTIIVGAPAEDSMATGVNGNGGNDYMIDSGAAYVFVRSNGRWDNEAYLKASNTGANDAFGYSVAIDGDTVVVGAPAESSNATGVNGNQSDNSLSSAGAAYIFKRNVGTWIQEAYLKASNTDNSAQFGISVAVSGNTVIAGASGESTAADSSGAAYIFTYSSSAWSQQGFIKAAHPAYSGNFGASVALSNDTAIVGSPYEYSNATGVNGDEANENASNSGAAFVFKRDAGTWSQEAYLKASNTDAEDHFGSSVSVSGDLVIVGAPDEASNATGLNGDQGDNSAGAAGAAYLFTRNGSTWSQHAYLKASNNEGGDRFGSAVAVLGNTLIVGAIGEDSYATGVNGDDTNNDQPDSGAAYTFLYTPPTAPVITSPTANDLATTSATLGANVTSDGGSTITERGIVWSLTSANADPLIGGNGVTQVTVIGTTGVFSVSVTNLTQVTGYSFKAYATNSVGTTYTSVTTFNTASNSPALITSNGGGNEASISIEENSTAVTTVTATDSDSPSATISFSKSGADAALFTLNTSTGVLSFTNAPNFEQPTDANSDGIYEVTVTATGAGTPNPSDTQALHITVTDVNEAPTDITLSPSRLAEGNPSNATVGYLGATDADVGDTQTYALVSGNGSTDNASFFIRNTNELMIIPVADFETKPSYSIRVRATDAGSLSFDKVLTVTITNVIETRATIPVNFGRVGRLVNQSLNIEGGYTATVTGLPPGLTYNATTRSITGRATAPGVYVATIIVKNTAKVVVSTQVVRIVVNAVPLTAVGTFIGIIAPDSAAPTAVGKAGGRIDLTTSATGTYTLKVQQGNLPLATLKGYLDVMATPVSLDVAMPATSGYVLHLELNDDNQQSLSGTATNGQHSSAITGWRNAFDKVNLPADYQQGHYTVALRQPSTNDGHPQGAGYISITIGLDGKTTVGGKAADGSAIATTGFLSAGMKVMVFQQLYKQTGGIFGLLDLSTNNLVDNRISGNLQWLHPTETTGRSVTESNYDLMLNADGYYAALNNTSSAVLDLPDAGVATSIDFSGVGLGLSNPNVANVTVAYPGLTTVVPVNATKTTLTFTKTTGMLSGSFILTDGLVKRTVTYQGLVVRDENGATYGIGYFLLPELPTGNLTLNTTQLRSGLFQWKP